MGNTIITELENGQIEVKKGNLTLTQTITNGQRHNDCTVRHVDWFELVSSHDERFKSLYISLVNYKNSGKLTF